MNVQWKTRPNPIYPNDKQQSFVFMSCDHVRGSIYEVIARDCPAFFTLASIKLAVIGLSFVLQLGRQLET